MASSDSVSTRERKYIFLRKTGQRLDRTMTELRAGKFNMHYMHRKLDRDRFASFQRPDGHRDQAANRVCRHLLTQTNSNLEVTIVDVLSFGGKH